MGRGAPDHAFTLPTSESLVWLTDVLERMVSGSTKARELERPSAWTRKAERLTVAGDR
jgi:hypothetical protein